VTIGGASEKGKRNMRKLAMLIVMTLALASFPALAGEVAVEAPLVDISVSATNAKAGAESLLLSPVAPAFGLFYGDPLLTDLGLDLGVVTPVTDRVVGLVTGGLAGAFAATTGLIDIFFALPAAVIGVGPVSPEPIVHLF
jgi:hypothetical protein